MGAYDNRKRGLGLKVADGLVLRRMGGARLLRQSPLVDFDDSPVQAGG